MGQTLTHGVYLPNEGERNCYSGLASNWRLLDGAIGTVAAHTTAIAGKADISHTHGNISNDGKVGTTANLPLITGTGGVVQAGSFGNAANTFCEGNDSRLSDARTPVAHTHTKNDVTNLFNSANSWTENNTYAKYILMKNTTVEVGNAPSNNTSKEISFTDKNNETLSRLVGKAEASGNSYIFLHATNKFTNNALDPNGSAKHSYFYVGLDATGKAYNKHAADTLPDANNTYDLGSSSYQWNNLYAKNYYYNGVAWGLDKINNWSKRQEIRLAELEDYTLPSSEVTTELLSWWGTTNFRGGFGHQYYTNGDEGCRFLLSSKDANNTSHLSAFRYKLNRAGTDSYFYGTGVQNFHLGTSTNRWKSLNGINPGSLSFPSGGTTENTDWFNVAGNILPAGGNATDFTGTPNYFTPSKDGWLALVVVNCSYISVWDSSNRMGQSLYVPDTTKNQQVLLPVLAGHLLEIRVIGSRWYSARLIMPQGNI